MSRVAEATGALTCDETLEAEGHALDRNRKTLRVLAQPDGGWTVETERPAKSRASTERRTKP